MDDSERVKEELRVARAALGVARQLDLAAVAEAFARAAQDHAQADASLLYLYDSEQDTFHLRGGHLAPDDPRRKGIVTLVFPVEQGAREVELELPGKFAVTPALKGAIKVVQGVREVEEV